MKGAGLKVLKPEYPVSIIKHPDIVAGCSIK
jgi:hypothetical protein